MTVWIILEPFTYSTKIVRRRFGPLLLYRLTFALCSSEMYMHEWHSIQWEMTRKTASKLCDKHDNYTFSMCISKNVNYSCWVHKLFEHVQKLRTGLQRLHAWEERCSNRLSLSLSLLEWPGMTRNDHSNQLELSIRPGSGVDSGQWDRGIMPKSHCAESTAEYGWM